ncbi:MAG: hypothetical protein HOC05_03300 [Gemmatimonadetes bacterium]|jgi:hypothetical protein|nr:hypothetical protein [Gemmatimonadota bacterium]MBT4609042.1 hypothetical protein [Gemmatimonadota bacterium]MBT5587995.1 hypothetical protein [Gemmatimonadota bacterium]MBT7593980.1 hypothetical protein [Gemmatimonadota bacterium]
MRWTTLPSDEVAFSGLPWIAETFPRLCRLPETPDLPRGVSEQARFASGAHLGFCSDTSQLHLKMAHAESGSGLDLYVDGQFWHTTKITDDDKSDVVCFADLPPVHRDISIYLPLRHELQISACGVDDDAEVTPSRPHAGRGTLVLYGSSVAQGIGAGRPGMGYSSILGRSLNMDVVNLGFGGAGKAEEQVVDLVSQTEACSYVLDLGKSYGLQSAEAYLAMLDKLGTVHPGVPIVCVTPIYSSREVRADYEQLSEHTRAVVRDAVETCSTQDGSVVLIEGEVLLSSQDADGLSSDGLHPNELGHTLIAQRLQPVIESALA